MHTLLTEQDITDFKEVFQLFDKNSVGIIQTKKIGTALRALGQNPTKEQLEDIINEFDPDSNGVIQFPEFLTLATRRHLEYIVTKKSFQSFDEIDKDGIGFISIDELKHSINRYVIDNFGKKLSDVDWQEILSQIVEQDGQVDYIRTIKNYHYQMS